MPRLDFMDDDCDIEGFPLEGDTFDCDNTEGYPFACHCRDRQQQNIDNAIDQRNTQMAQNPVDSNAWIHIASGFAAHSSNPEEIAHKADLLIIEFRNRFPYS